MNRDNLNNTSRTDWTALEAMSGEDIDHLDISPLADEFFEQATLQIPANKTQNLVKLEPDIKQWLEAQGAEYQDLINQALGNYIAKTAEI